MLSGCTDGSAADSGAPYTLGNPDAKVLIEEFSDPECPACGIISPEMEALTRANPDLIYLKYYHYPLSYHEYAFVGAEASECAGAQGKFFEYLGTLYANQNKLSDDYFYDVADSLELDRTAFDSCLANHDYKDKILSHMAAGKERQLPGTPSFYVNGEMVRWSGSEAFKAYLESL